MVALSFLLWFQGYVFAWKYGPLDGRPISWNTYWFYGVIDASVWISIIFLSIKKTSFLLRFAQTVATSLMVIQLISVTLTHFQLSEDTRSFKRYMIDESSKFHFSSQKNVILIVLDEFQSNIFQEIVVQNERYKTMFDGFVYFPDAVAPFSWTELSIPAILTGQIFDNSIKRNAYLKKSFTDKSIPKILKENNFEVHLFPLKNWEHRTMYLSESVCSNLNKDPDYGVQFKETLLLFDLSLFRHFPHFMKKYIYCDNQWLFSRYFPAFHRLFEKYFCRIKENIYGVEQFRTVESPKSEFEGSAFIGSAMSSGQFQVKKNVFKFYHLWGTHIPLRINENSEVVGQVAYNKKNYTRQAKAYLETCDKFFGILKEKGAYDNCLIFVIGDHGSGRSEDMYINRVSDSHNDSLNQISPYNNFQLFKARGIPLLLAKQFNSKGTLKISDAPVCLIDIPKTIISEFGIAADFSGISLFEAKAEESRKRYYGAFEWDEKQTDFMKPITMYVVAGPSWSNESWSVVSILPPKE